MSVLKLSGRTVYILTYQEQAFSFATSSNVHALISLQGS